MDDGRPSTPTLETDRLILRPSRLADAEAITALANNPRIVENTSSLPFPYTIADAIAWIEGGDEADRHPVRFAIIAKHRDGAIIGACGLGRAQEGGLEIGYWIGEPFWGDGLATEAARAVIDYGFDTLALERILGRCRVNNHGSRRVMVKCGFQPVGPGMVESRYFGGPVPVDTFVLDRGTWKSLRTWRTTQRCIGASNDDGDCLPAK